MAVSLKCTDPACGERIKVRDLLDSKKVKCPVCEADCRPAPRKPSRADKVRRDIEPETWYSGLHPIGRVILAGMLAVPVMGVIVAIGQPIPGLLLCVSVLLPVMLFAGMYQCVTLQSGKKGQPVLVRRKVRFFFLVRTVTYDLTKYGSLGVDNAEHRHRQYNPNFGFQLFGWLLVGGLLPSTEMGGGTGKWVLKLKYRGEYSGAGTAVFAHSSLFKVKNIAAAITAETGLRVGRELPA